MQRSRMTCRPYTSRQDDLAWKTRSDGRLPLRSPVGSMPPDQVSVTARVRQSTCLQSGEHQHLRARSASQILRYSRRGRRSVAGEATRGIAKKGCSVGLCAYALVNLTPPVSRQSKQVEAFESDSSASVDAATLPRPRSGMASGRKRVGPQPGVLAESINRKSPWGRSPKKNRVVPARYGRQGLR